MRQDVSTVGEPFMGVIYCLYSTQDCEPRYVGQTTQPPDYRRRQHVAEALNMEGGAVSEWIRMVWSAGYEVEIYVLQDDVRPSDLPFFEDYWMSKFAGLINTRGLSEGRQDHTDVGKNVVRAIRLTFNQSKSPASVIDTC
jgi:hypothetical protein